MPRLSTLLGRSSNRRPSVRLMRWIRWVARILHTMPYVTNFDLAPRPNEH